MHIVGRALALVLIAAILIVTPVAFWLFNFQRVALDPQTYKTALRSQNVYQDLLPALIDQAATGENNVDPAHRAALQSLLDNMSQDDWAALADKVLPPAWLQTQLEGNINRFFNWINSARATPGVNFDLTELKTRLSGPPAKEAAQVVVPKLPACTVQQDSLIDAAVSTGNLDNFPLCNPTVSDRRQVVINTFSNVLNAVGQQLPDRWDLDEQLRKGGPSSQHISELELPQFRAAIWLQSRLTVLLLLAPLALLSMIVVVAIRSGKQFFRWTGWALIASGLLTLVPVPFMPGLTLGLFAGSRGDIQQGFGESGRLLGSLIGGMISSIASGLTLSILVQIAIVIALGFVLVVLSVLLPTPEPEVTPAQVRQEQISQPPLAPAMPQAFSSPSLATTLGTTPLPRTPAGPEPLQDGFDNQP